MAKRVADQQLTKDGTMSDEDVFTVGSQIGGPQKATAAQMAQRRYVISRDFWSLGWYFDWAGGCNCLSDQIVTRRRRYPQIFHLTSSHNTSTIKSKSPTCLHSQQPRTYSLSLGHHLMGYSPLARGLITNRMVRLAKPRGGRRPGALRPPASPSFQPQQNSFGESNRLNTNGTQQQGGFTFGQQPNGYQPNQNSASFPPFPSSTFNPSFAAPTTGFNFNASQAQEVNNPFTAINTNNAPPPEQTGFQGSIFNIPPQKMSPFQKFLEGEQKPVFAPGAPDLSTPSQSQHASNLFNMSNNQQQPSQASTGIFSQPGAHQQPPNNPFGQITDQSAPQPTTDLFAHLKTPQNQSASNPFAESIAQFQQSQSAQPATSLFAHLGQPQSSSSFLAQGSTSPTQGGSMMQISPDPSPQSRPFGFLSQPNTQTQSSPTKDSTAQGGGGSLFDRISKPPAETRSDSLPSQTSDTSTQIIGGSLFDRISKPPTEPSAQNLASPVTNDSATDSNPSFNVPQAPPTSTVSNGTGATSPTKISERKIAKPTLFQAPSEEAHPSYKAIFGNLKMPPTSQFSPSATSDSERVLQPSPSQPKIDSASPVRGFSHTPSSFVPAQQPSENTKSLPGSHHIFGPPSAPEGYTEEEARQWSQDWWISFFVLHKERRIKSAEHQCDQRIKAVQEGLDPLKQIAGSKRKPVPEGRRGEEDGIQGKRARIQGASTFSPVSGGASPNGNGLSQSPSKRHAPVQQMTNKNNKRSADEELEKEKVQITADNSKKARIQDPVSYPSLSAASPGSQTSNIFKNILDKKEEAKTNGTQNNKAAPLFQFPAPSGSSSNQSLSMFKPSSTSSAPLSSQPQTVSPPKPSFDSSNPASSRSNSGTFANHQSSSNGAQVMTSTSFFKPTGPTAGPSTASNPGPFSLGPTPSNETPSDATKALAVKFSSGGTTATALSSTHFSANATTADQTSSGDAKAPAFKVPNFGAAAASNASSPSPFSIKSSMSNQKSSEAPNAPAFKVPTFGNSASSTNFISQFGKAAEKTAAEEKKKRKAAEFDSDEEDLETWEARDAQEQQLKKQKLEDETKGKAAKLIDGKWVIAANNEISKSSAKQAEPADPNISVLSQPRASLTNGHNIFGHLSGEESGAEGSKTGDADDEDDENEQDDETSEQRQMRGPFDYNESDEGEDEESQAKKPKELSNPFGATENGPFKSSSHHITAEKANGEDTGRSLFDRISRDKEGNPIREIPPAGNQEVPQTSSVFGQSFKSGSSSNPFSQPSDATSSFTSTNSNSPPKGDHTWKIDTPIKFGDSSNAPSVNVTSPSPSKPTFGGLFGASKPSISTEASAKPTTSLFTTPPAKTPSVGFSFGLKPATASLAPPFNNGSNTTSRATSPGATTGESATESNADGDDDKAEKQEQIDLTSPGPGEEDEDVVLQVKAKALKWDTASSTWTSKGVGPLRVLKNRESHLARVLLRQDPSGRIVLNFALSKSFTYESSQSKTVRVPFVGESGKIETWMIKVGNDDDAKKLASALETNKN